MIQVWNQHWHIQVVLGGDYSSFTTRLSHLRGKTTHKKKDGLMDNSQTTDDLSAWMMRIDEKSSTELDRRRQQTRVRYRIL